MIPLLSRKCITILAIGLVIGVLAGIGYWYVSPVQLQVQLGWPPIQLAGLLSPPSPVYSTSVFIEPLAQGGDGQPQKNLQYLAEGWAYRLNTTPFYDFVAEELGDDIPWLMASAQAVHNPIDPEERDTTQISLAQMKAIVAKPQYDGLVTRVDVTVMGETELEALYIAQNIPELLQEFLIQEGLASEMAQYEEDLSKLELVKAQLEVATSELARSPLPGNSTYTQLQASQIATEAKIVALDNELDGLSAQLAALIGSGNMTGSTHDSLLNRIEAVSSDLAIARNLLDSLKFELEGASLNADYEIARATVSALLYELETVSDRIALPPSVEEVQTDIQDLYIALEPSPAEPIYPDRVRGRNAVMMGAVLGVGGAWLGVNRKVLIQRIRSYFPSSTPQQDETDGEREVEE
jgi:hypothetical protein